MRNIVKGITLFKKGDKGNYIVKEGKLELITNYSKKF